MDKKTIREIMKKQRKALYEYEKKEYSEMIYKKISQLSEYTNAKSVCVYMDAFSEVQTECIINDLRKQGKDVIFPVSDVKTNTLTLCRDCGTFRKGAYGISEPEILAEVPYSYPDLVIIPGLAFDKSKNRLGFGAGYYDRFLVENKGKKIGICYDFQIIDLIPAEAHDVKMDMIISEKQIIS